MSTNVSVSKGCFAFPKRRKGKDILGQYPKEAWYKAYKKAWASFEQNYQEMVTKSLTDVLQGVIKYVAESPNLNRQNDELPSATLLTGVNMTDHTTLFSTLTSELKKEVTPHVAVLWAQDCNNLKTTVERLCSQFMTIEESDEEIDEDDAEGDIKAMNSGISKVHCTFPVLLRWYQQLSNSEDIYYKNKKLQSTGADKPLVVIIPNFECFSHKVLQDLILILSANRKSIPVMLILGVATSVSAVHRSLPHHVSSKLCIQLFKTQPTSVFLSKILDTVILSPERPFHLGSKTFKTLLDVFLLYDFSVSGFIQGLKFCMTEHFYGKKWAALCCGRNELSDVVSSLTEEDWQSVMSLPSVRRHIESLPTAQAKKDWIMFNDSVRVDLLQLLHDLHGSYTTFYSALCVLQIFLVGLPKNPLGKHLRELYAIAMSTNITNIADYQECVKLLRFISRDELIEKLEKVYSLFPEDCTDYFLCEFTDDLEEFILKLKCLGANILTPKSPPAVCPRTPTKSPLKSPVKAGLGSPPKKRSQIREKIIQMAEQQKTHLSPYEQLREVVLARLEKFWVTALVPPTGRVLHEVMFFDDLAAVRPNIIGTPRRAVHTALNDPHHYLQCECCQLSSPNDILPTLPDLSIVYKLHLENGRHINMYDWLQAYLTIVSPSETGDEQREVDPKLQARFTRAVAELQFLGYIKSSSRKTDHVMRLTWN